MAFTKMCKNSFCVGVDAAIYQLVLQSHQAMSLSTGKAGIVDHDAMDECRCAALEFDTHVYLLVVPCPAVPYGLPAEVHALQKACT